MSRILYGVMGDAQGHVNHALVTARELARHEFLFIGGGTVKTLAALGYAVENIPMPGTLYKNHAVDMVATATNAVRVLLGRSRTIRRLLDVIRSFKPDLVISDWEYFSQMAAKRSDTLCLSLDHQHAITHLRYPDPPEERLSRLMQATSVRLLFSNADKYFIVSFFDAEPRDPATTRVFRSLIRKEIVAAQSTQGEHVLVYQTSPTFHRLFPVLESIPRKFIIYGFGAMPARKNLVFKDFSHEGFVQDLATSRYAITNAGHNVISECLYLKKPVLAFPIKNAYEQYLNSHFLRVKGYGNYSLSQAPNPAVLRDFESKLDKYTERIHTSTILGNREIADAIEALIARGS